MELAIGSTVATFLGWRGYKYIREHTTTSVNCWFCNENTRVAYKQRNCFLCPHCDQYNGFNDSGGYNRIIPGQHTPSSRVIGKRFCSPSSKQPDLVSSTGQNGLCPTCNQNQAIIVKHVANFEPISDEKWEEKLEDFRYRLDKLYPLCDQCTIHAHRRLQNDKVQYEYLLKLRDTVAPTIISACRTVKQVASKVTRGDRRNFFTGGFSTVLAQSLTLLSIISLFVAHLDYLQEDAEVSLVTFPPFVQMTVPFVLNTGLQVGLLTAVLQIIALLYNKCRTNLPDLLLPIFTLMYIVSYALPQESYREDLALCRCATTALMVVLSTAVTFLPRKKLHRKRPNRVLSSAFSIASTPASQCSSANTTSLSSSPHEKLSHSGNRSSASGLPFPSLRSRLQWRERLATPAPEESNRRFARERSPDEDMEWESSVVNAPPSTSQHGGRLFAGRESTPARELAPSLSSLSIAQGPKGSPSLFGQSKRTPSLFSTTKSQHSAQFLRNQMLFSPTSFPSPPVRVERAPSMSGFTSISQRMPRRLDDSPPACSPSEFSSVSQQQPGCPLSFRWICFFTLIGISSVMGNIAFFYVVFQKR